MFFHADLQGQHQLAPNKVGERVWNQLEEPPPFVYDNEICSDDPMRVSSSYNVSATYPERFFLKFALYETNI